jgi:hypothetical protein
MQGGLYLILRVHRSREDSKLPSTLKEARRRNGSKRGQIDGRNKLRHGGDLRGKTGLFAWSFKKTSS